MKFCTPFLQGLLFLALPQLALAQVGNPAPNFTVTDTHGDTHTLYQYLDSGKVVVLDFFFTTCIPCQYYSPQVNAAYEKYGCNTGKVIFMSIDYGDSNAEVEAYDQTYHIKFPSVSGQGGGGNNVVGIYNILGFPTLYVIDSTKKIIEQIDPPTLQVFNYRFNQHGILPVPCLSATQESGFSPQLQLFPNPVAAGQNIQIYLPGFEKGTLRFEISNYMGQRIQDGLLELSTAQECTLDTRYLASGTYLLKINDLGSGKMYNSLFFVE